MGDRCLHHARASLNAADASLKLDRIREIKSERGCDPSVVFIRHGLQNNMSQTQVAAEIEAAVIDVLMRWKVALTHLVRGAGVDGGLRSLESLQAERQAKPLVLPAGHTAMIVNISRTWSDGMEDKEAWEAPCCWWKADPAKPDAPPNPLARVSRRDHPRRVEVAVGL